MSAEDELDAAARLRVPPHSIESEQSVLGALLGDNRGWDRVGDLVTAASFYRHEHRLIFEAVGALVAASKPADPITVFEQLERTGKANDVGGLKYLSALEQSVPSASNIRRYAEIVAERHLERRIIAAADEAATMAFNGQGRGVTERLDEISTKFRQLEGSTLRGVPRSLADLVLERVDHINDLSEKGETATSAAWPTPLPALNRLLSGGLRPGRVYVLAARPSVGKSALAQTIALRAARNNLPTLFLSQEMPDHELADRILAQMGTIDFGHMQTGKLEPEEWTRLTSAVDLARVLPLFVDDQASLTIGQIRAKARQVPDLRVLVVDYLQLTASAPTTGRNAPNRNAEIEEVSRGLKTLAKELGLAVVLLSQLNREVEKRPGKKPLISDLRDSGAIEQDADVVMLMWQLPHASTEDGCTMLGIDVAKNRGGAKDEFPVCFWGRHMRFGEAALPMTHYTSKPGSGGGDL